MSAEIESETGASFTIAWTIALNVVSIVDRGGISKIRRAHVIDVFTHHVPGTGFVKKKSRNNSDLGWMIMLPEERCVKKTTLTSYRYNLLGYRIID